jgi:senescence-induced receptor-like serine/threonine-protein kinase
MFWNDVYTDNILVPDRDYEIPSAVMQTAATSSGSLQTLDISWTSDDKSSRFMVILHISEIQYNLSSSDHREFDIIVNGVLMGHNIVPEKDFLGHAAFAVGFDTSYTMSLRPTSRSTLPPLLNAFELYVVAPVTGLPTYSGDGMFQKYSLIYL